MAIIRRRQSDEFSKLSESEALGFYVLVPRRPLADGFGRSGSILLQCDSLFRQAMKLPILGVASLPLSTPPGPTAPVSHAQTGARAAVPHLDAHGTAAVAVAIGQAHVPGADAFELRHRDASQVASAVAAHPAPQTATAMPATQSSRAAEVVGGRIYIRTGRPLYRLTGPDAPKNPLGQRDNAAGLIG